MIYPRPLKKGDKIAICSPAGRIMPDIVNDAADVLRGEGYRVEIMPHALGESGNYSGTADERYADMRDAFADPEVRLILCSRGGYGVVHNLERLDQLPLADDPKWVAGFSDISALHALMTKKGIVSIHSLMCAGIKRGADDEDIAAFLDILEGGRPVHIFDGHYYDRPGIATGTIFGGNVAVLAELINTPFDFIKPDTILFIEDIAEPIYKIERILYQLRLSGVLGSLKGLIVGQFTDYKPDLNYDSMEAMIHDMTAEYDYPVAFNAPIGHVDHNVPLVESAKVTLKVSPEGRNSIIFHR